MEIPPFTQRYSVGLVEVGCICILDVSTQDSCDGGFDCVLTVMLKRIACGAMTFYRRGRYSKVLIGPLFWGFSNELHWTLVGLKSCKPERYPFP